MKDFILLTAVCIAVVVGVGWFLLPGSRADLFHSRVTIAAETPDASSTSSVSASPAAAHDPHLKAIPISTLHTDSRTMLAASVAPARVATSSPVATAFLGVLNLPLPWDVLPGEEGSSVVADYGAPALSTSTQDSGHLFETYVYRNSGEQAIIHLEDGKVSRVLLKPSPQLGRP